MIRATLTMLALFTVITGLAYPLLMTGVAEALFRDKARGSLLMDGGKVTGSRLIGQQYEDPKYFWGRLSATPQFAYNAGSSSGSNFGPLSPDLRKAMDARREALRKADPENTAAIPVDLLTSSGSGLDPHISPEGAEYQSNRVARARGIEVAAVRKLIAEHSEGRQWGILGEPVVNVVLLNRALDQK